jgi:hypothetical protein
VAKCGDPDNHIEFENGLQGAFKGSSDEIIQLRAFGEMSSHDYDGVRRGFDGGREVVGLTVREKLPGKVDSVRRAFVRSTNSLVDTSTTP